MEEAKTYILGDNGGNSALPWIAAMNNGNNGGLLGGGLGSGFVGGIFGGLLSNVFGWGNGGVGGGNAGAAALGAQATANNNTDLLIQAVTSEGAQSRAAIQALSTSLGQDFNVVNTQVQGIQSILNNMAIQNATTPLQVINQIDKGNAAMAAQFAQCCCENRLGICEQTNTLTQQADRNANSILQAINAQTVAMNDQFCQVKEREMQNQIEAQKEIINQLRTQAANQTVLNQVAAMLAPLQQQINFIASRQPNTVPVVWPQLTVTAEGTSPAAVAATAASGK